VKVQVQVLGLTLFVSSKAGSVESFAQVDTKNRKGIIHTEMPNHDATNDSGYLSLVKKVNQTM
jgi:hypothetical protein